MQVVEEMYKIYKVWYYFKLNLKFQKFCFLLVYLFYIEILQLWWCV